MLSSNPIAQGSVDSVLGVFAAGSRRTARASSTTGWWRARISAKCRIDNQVMTGTRRPSRAPPPHAQLLEALGAQGPPGARRPVARCSSSATGRACSSSARRSTTHGAVIAANDSGHHQFARDTYSYMWPRDGALVSVALLRTGPRRRAGDVPRLLLPDHLSARLPAAQVQPRRHARLFVARLRPRRQGRPPDPGRRDGAADLGALAVLRALPAHRGDGAVLSLAGHAARRFHALLRRPGDRPSPPSYDLWEERWGVHAFTVAAVIAASRGARGSADAFGEIAPAPPLPGRRRAYARRATHDLWNEHDQRFARMATPGPVGYTLDMTIDSSLFGLVGVRRAAPRSTRSRSPR